MGNYIIESFEGNPWKNLALEKCIAERVQTGDVILYLWQNDNTVVIGRNQNALRECRAQLLEADGGYLARRTTGGGTVFHDMGNLCFTFAADPEKYDLQKQMRVVQLACRYYGIETCLSGRNDIITENGQKFSGNAFSVSSKCNIQHGTIMIDVSVEKLKRYLTPSKEKMKAKGIKSVRSRVCNLRELNNEITVEGMRQALKDAFTEEYGAYSVLNTSDLNQELYQHTFEQYASWDWRYGKSPDCESIYQKRFDWGEIEIYLKLKKLFIEECKVYSDALDVELPQLIENKLLGKRYDRLLVETTDADTEQELKAAEVIRWLSDNIGAAD